MMTTPTLREALEDADATITALLGYCSDQTSTAKDAIETLAAIRAALAAQPELPQGMVYVPKHMTREMLDIVEQDDWHWEDLLAAAAAITVEEYAEISRGPEPESSEPDEYGPTPGCKQCEESQECGFAQCMECGAVFEPPAAEPQPADAQPELPEPVAAQSKFIDGEEWGWCSMEHHYLVKEHPYAWPAYETRLLYAEQVQVAQAPLSEIALANQTSRIYPPDEMIASGIYMQAWRDAEAHHHIKDKA